MIICFLPLSFCFLLPPIFILYIYFSFLSPTPSLHFPPLLQVRPSEVEVGTGYCLGTEFICQEVRVWQEGCNGGPCPPVVPTDYLVSGNYALGKFGKQIVESYLNSSGRSFNDVGHSPDGNWHFSESTSLISPLKHFLILIHVKVLQSFPADPWLNV